MKPSIAFYAPMKPPDHPSPSGDRRIARLTLAALECAGFAPETVSVFRCIDTAGDPAVQARLTDEAEREAERVLTRLAKAPPVAWYTYHSHYKSPDLIGPVIASRLDLPYLISEPSVSPRRREGPWADFARASDTALGAAGRLLWTTARDRPGLEAAGFGPKMIHLPAFLAIGPVVAPRPAGAPLRLLTVAMMRGGDKAESYRRLAAALARLEGEWRLTVVGDGPERKRVEELLTPFGERVELVGAIDDDVALRALMETADIFLWPGVNEGVGMAWLEAQAAGLPVVAEDGPAAREIIAGGILAPPDDPHAMARAVGQVAIDRSEWSAKARTHVEQRHGLDAAARLLGSVIGELVAGRAARTAS